MFLSCKDCGTTNEEDFKDSITDDWCDDCSDKSYYEWIKKDKGGNPMKIKYFTFQGSPRVNLSLGGKNVGTYTLTSREGIRALNYDINWCHRQLNLHPTKRCI
tara:strand:+ start:682 stop:990 length:309 start_codon:yes stop_codon:yes gene_type:complete